jgi:hypothetical protein
MLGNTDMKFDPFENRRCRDIRNHLGHIFVRAIQEKDPDLFQAGITACQIPGTPAHIIAYTRHRQACFEKVFFQMETGLADPGDHFNLSLVLWNLELFFEFHEWLEIQWTGAEGNDKRALQALILAAVVYEQLAYDRKIPAKKVATKALLLFRQHRDRFPKIFDLDLFIERLTGPDPVPPKFGLPQ